MMSEIKLKLPSGESLVAAVCDESQYPSITIYLDRGGERDAICFAEHNPEKPAGRQLCIGAYTEKEEDVVYYESYFQA